MIEFYTELISTLRWWKILIFLLLSIGLVVTFADKNDFNIWQFYVPSWVGQLIRPRISKLNYLLPGDAKSRTSYLFYSSVGLTLFFVLWYAAAHGINIILGNYDLTHALLKLSCEDLLIIILFVSGNIGTSFLTKKVKTKENKIKMTLMIILLIFPAIHVAVLVRILHGVWYVAATLLSYLCCLPFCSYAFLDIKNYDTSYENIKKPVKFSI